MIKFAHIPQEYDNQGRPIRGGCFEQDHGRAMHLGSFDVTNADPRGHDDPDDEEHDNEGDGLVKCGECKGTGEYVGLLDVEKCRECDGSGWV